MAYSKIRTWDPGPGTPGAKNLRPWDPGPGTPELAVTTLGYGTLTPETLEMGPWDHETSNWPPPQIVLALFVKQILIIKSQGMGVENVGARIQK